MKHHLHSPWQCKHNNKKWSITWWIMEAECSQQCVHYGWLKALVIGNHLCFLGCVFTIFHLLRHSLPLSNLKIGMNVNDSYHKSEEVSRWKAHIKENMENNEIFQHTQRFFRIRRVLMFVNIQQRWCQFFV